MSFQSENSYHKASWKWFSILGWTFQFHVEADKESSAPHESQRAKSVWTYFWRRLWHSLVVTDCLECNFHSGRRPMTSPVRCRNTNTLGRTAQREQSGLWSVDLWWGLRVTLLGVNGTRRNQNQIFYRLWIQKSTRLKSLLQYNVSK